MTVQAILAFGGAAAVAALATRALLPLLPRLHLVDVPNERSSHARVTPKGGGIAVVLTIALAWLFVVPEAHWPVLALAVLLAVMGLWDDIAGLPAGLRLVLQAIAVWAGLRIFEGVLFFQGLLPPLADKAVVGLAWLWFVNLFNFMDGIDGIAGIETVAIAGGVAVGLVLLGEGRGALAAAVVAGAALGFLIFNWPPAKVFLGDVGSQPLGFVLGFLLLGLAARGAWAAALILPLYFLADATITLLRRLARGEKVWQAHRGHFYQHATQGLGGKHRPVVERVLLLDLALVALALAAVLRPTWAWGMLGLAVLATAGLLVHFDQLGKAKGHGV